MIWMMLLFCTGCCPRSGEDNFSDVIFSSIERTITMLAALGIILVIAWFFKRAIEKGND
jgi:hypothetical protein